MDGSDLKEAIMAKLKVDVSPDRLRVLLEVEGGLAKPLDGFRKVKEGGVEEGSFLTLEEVVIPATPPHAPSSDAVIAWGPDLALDQTLLAALASSEPGAASQRVGVLTRLVRARLAKEPQTPGDLDALPLFDTEAHGALLEFLVSHADALAGGGFRGLNGVACRTLVGARGIGKTAVMRAFATVCASAFPGIVPLYVSAEGIDSVLNPFQGAQLGDMMCEAVRARGVSVPSLHDLDFALHKSGLRVLVLLDEVDDLYRVSMKNPAAVSNVTQTLGHLAILGGQRTGLYGVLLCGSSSTTYSLVCGQTGNLGYKFPLHPGCSKPQQHQVHPHAAPRCLLCSIPRGCEDAGCPRGCPYPTPGLHPTGAPVDVFCGGLPPCRVPSTGCSGGKASHLAAPGCCRPCGHPPQ